MSPQPLNLMKDAVGQPRPQLVYGQVSSNQPLPSSDADPLYVVIPDWQTDFYFPVEWSQIHGATLPAAGADVLLASDNRRNLRCIWWAGDYTPATG